MSAATVYEVIGYAGSALIVLSLMMHSVLRLRWINLVGAAIFTVYGVLIAAPPVWVVNAAIVVIDIYHLTQLKSDRREAFEMLEVDPAATYLTRFLAFHRDGIARFQPEFDGIDPAHRVFLVLRDLMPVGVLAVGRPDADGTAVVDLDYVIPGYRDLRPGSFLFKRGTAKAALGVDRLVSEPGAPAHQRYLAKMGFVRRGDRFERPL
jgi:hypothetical protein